MKLNRSLMLAAALALPFAAVPATAQTPVPVIAPGNALLTVSAEGRSLRQPDLAVFSAGVTTQGKTAGEALGANAAAMNRVIAALKKMGIAARDVQTSNLSISPIYSDPEREAMLAARASNQAYVPSPQPEPARIIGYNVSNTVSVRQRKLGEYGKVIDTLVSAGANQINGPAFQMDDPDPALDEARLEAMKKARARAELYARAANLRVLRIVSISEGGGYSGPQPMMARMKFDVAEAAAPSPVEAGELQLTANVSVLFELAP
ncbi:MAG: SIMPL domain-containing protein [Novosphingobium sp.]